MPFYDGFMIVNNAPPSVKWRRHLQDTVDKQFENASTWWDDIYEEKEFGSDKIDQISNPEILEEVFNKIEARITSLIDAKSGQRDNDDYKQIIYKNTSYKPKSICKNSSFAKTQKKKMNLSMDYKDYYDNDEDLLHKLGSRFEEIKTKGINRYKDNIIEKNNRKYELEKSIESLQKQIRMYKSKKNYWIKENAKVVNDIKSITTI